MIRSKAGEKGTITVTAKSKDLKEMLIMLQSK